VQNADAVDALGAEAVQQASGGQLRADIGVAEGGGEQTEAGGAEVQLMLHSGAGDRQRGAIRVAERTRGEEHAYDQISDV
jgi:hypothetical protein